MFKAILGSIATRLALVTALMAAAVGTGLYMSNRAFDRNVADLRGLAGGLLPEAQRASELVATVKSANVALLEILVADTATDVAAARRTATETLESVDEIASGYAPSARAEMQDITGAISASIAGLSQGLLEEFELRESVQAVLAKLELDVQAASDILEAEIDRTRVSLSAGGSATVDTVTATLGGIVDRDVLVLRLTLGIQADANLLGGALLAMSDTADEALKSTMLNLATTALGSIDAALVDLDDMDMAGVDLATVRADIDFFRDALGANSFILSQLRNDLLATLQKTEAELTAVLDGLVAKLERSSLQASTGNADAIRNLLGGPVEQIVVIGELETALSKLLADGLLVSVSGDAEALVASRKRFSVAGEELSRAAAGSSEGFRARINGLLAAVEGSGSLPATVERLIDVRGTTEARAIETAIHVAQISDFVSAIGAESLSQIDKAAVNMSEVARTAQSGLRLALIASALIFVLMGLVVQFSVVRPLLRLCRTTERLAAGDLDSVSIGRAGHGEIGRLNKALMVFRDSLAEKAELEKNEAALREAAEAERAAALKAEREQEETARAEKTAAEEKERQREAEAEAEREAARKVAEEARLQQIKQQETVVGALATALEKLSVGNLDARITTSFPEGYEQLRLDFNKAIENLSMTVSEIRGSGQIIHRSTADISASALDLSRRTELSAATLEETAAAMDQLTAAIKTSANGAQQAQEVVSDARARAEDGREVVEATVGVMDEISKSSEMITRITGVIDDIAFQTNLLALNAGVEAARAGEAGRGFAVVASEVRGLAQRSSEAAKEISTLIADSGNHVSRGVDMVGRTGKALEAITVSVSQTSEKVTEIANSASEQAAGIDDMNRALSELDQVTQQNAAMFEETTAASTTLTQETDSLATALDQFNLATEPVDGGSVHVLEVPGAEANAASQTPLAPKSGQSAVEAMKGSAVNSGAATAAAIDLVGHDQEDDWSDF
ncbi:MAG: methyl-accepting chemotaxis protein [Pseudomonadota bacterium]